MVTLPFGHHEVHNFVNPGQIDMNLSELERYNVGLPENVKLYPWARIRFTNTTMVLMIGMSISGIWNENYGVLISSNHTTTCNIIQALESEL